MTFIIIFGIISLIFLLVLLLLPKDITIEIDEKKDYVEKFREQNRTFPKTLEELQNTPTDSEMWEKNKKAIYDYMKTGMAYRACEICQDKELLFSYPYSNRITIYTINKYLSELELEHKLTSRDTCEGTYYYKERQDNGNKI